MSPIKLMTALFLILLVLATPGLRAQDDPPETPDERAKRLKILQGKIKDELAKVLSDDVVVRGDALEAIARAGPELKEIEVEGLLDTVIESGVTAPDRFIAVLAGEIVNHLDPKGAVDEIDRRALGSKSPGVRRRMGLAMISEIPIKRSGELASALSSGGNAETRVHALIALGKLRLPETYQAMASALGAQDEDVKSNAAIALGKLKDPRAIPALLNHLESADGDHPAFAAWALKQFDDPKIFASIAGHLKGDSKEPGNAKARIIESCSQAEHIDKLKEILQGNRSVKYRYAAALALGRLGARDVDVQRLLLKGLVKGKVERVRWACFFGLSECASQAIAEDVVEALKAAANARNDAQHGIFRCLAFIAGDLKLKDAAYLLYKVARLHHKTELTWRVAAVNFWKCANPDVYRKIKDDFDAASDKRVIGQLARILGRSRRVEEFKYLSRQFKRFGKTSEEAFSVELALEQMTGHFFGPDYGIWRHWFDKNETFFEPREYRIDRRQWQQDFTKKDREFRQTAETERAVQLGLSWISRHISLKGSLDPNKFFERCSHKPTCKKTGSRWMLDKIGCSSLAALACLGGGYSVDKGKYKDTLQRLLDYIEIRQTADGNFPPGDRFEGYQRPIAIYALAEAFNITGDMRYEPYLRRGINFMVEIQNELGGWHYQVGARETDTSVMSWVLLGLGVAHKSGFPVRESVFEGCDMILTRYAERVTEQREEFMDLDPHYSYDVGKTFRGEYQTGYQSKVSENATTSFGLMSRMFMGWRRSHPFCIGSGYFVLAHNMERMPKGGNFDKYVSKNRFPAYAWYYGTLAMHQMGGHFFRRWNKVIKELLPGLQNKEGCDAGSWPVLNYDFVAGKAYTTCMGVLTLETYYRYKPFCEEGVVEEED